MVQTIYDIVKAHGGELRLESTEGAGTSFKIIIPLEGKKQIS